MTPLGRSAGSAVLQPDQTGSSATPRGRTQVKPRALEKLLGATVAETEGVEVLQCSYRRVGTSEIDVAVELAVFGEGRLVERFDVLHRHMAERTTSLSGLTLRWLEIDVRRLHRSDEPVSTPRVL